jgi:hypothetical protein
MLSTLDKIHVKVNYMNSITAYCNELAAAFASVSCLYSIT